MGMFDFGALEHDRNRPMNTVHVFITTFMSRLYTLRSPVLAGNPKLVSLFLQISFGQSNGQTIPLIFS
jgi:hypothetical protein